MNSERTRRTAACLWAAVAGSILTAANFGHAAPPTVEMEFAKLDISKIEARAPGELRIGWTKVVAPSVDLLFLHGHADRFDNHADFYARLAQSGVRVVGFDLPSHGESNVAPIDLALATIETTTEDPERPLVIAG